MVDRAQVLAYAQRHGPKAAAARFGIPVGTIWSWRARERRRAAQRQADQERAAAARPALPVPGPVTPAQSDLERAAQLAAWIAQGACLQCGGAGLVRVPPTTRGSMVIRRGRTIPCPTCGGRQVHVQVNELPRQDWTEGLRAAGDLGLGWSPEDWARIRHGEPNPDGQRFTHGERRV
jgi:hypothetical protein